MCHKRRASENCLQRCFLRALFLQHYYFSSFFLPFPLSLRCYDRATAKYALGMLFPSAVDKLRLL